MEFEEGIHKSSQQETAFESEQEPESTRSPKRRWFLISGVVLLLCIVVGGGILSFQLLRNPHTTAPVTSTHPGWCSVPVVGLNTSAGTPELNGIDAVSSRDIWMDGYLVSQSSNTPNQAVIEHWNGTSLSVMPSPNSGENGSRLKAIAEIAPNNAWAVGSVLQTPQNANSQGDFLGGIHTLIEHWDGHHWSIVPSPDGATETNGHNELQGIAASSANDVWAVGSSSHGALIEHWDGNQWGMLNLPDAFHANFLQAVVAPAKDDIWVAGSADVPPGQGALPLLAHWDGQQWTQISGLDHLVSGPNVSFFLLSLQASSPHDIWLTGDAQITVPAGSNPSSLPGPTGQTIIAHWDGANLQQQTLPKLILHGTQNPNDASTLYQDQSAVFVRSSNNIWVAGGGSSFAPGTTVVPVFIAHWDGKRWKVMSLPQAPVGQLSVLAVAGGKVWTAGTTYIGDQQTPAQLVEMSC